MFIVEWTNEGIKQTRVFEKFTLADDYYDCLIDEMIETDFKIDNVQVYELLSSGKVITLYKEKDKKPYLVLIENLELGSEEIKFFQKAKTAKVYYEQMLNIKSEHENFYLAKILNSTYKEE